MSNMNIAARAAELAQEYIRDNPNQAFQSAVPGTPEWEVAISDAAYLRAIGEDAVVTDYYRQTHCPNDEHYLRRVADPEGTQALVDRVEQRGY